ncbi:MAG: MATE family efflux transporter, partial [Methanobrevibacter sp.]|nr:MATE family efflux transporter [Methanobrevibacter sp.]
SLMWTIIREVIFTVTATYTLGIALGWGLVGIWTGLALGRTLASILNFAFARYTIRKVRAKFGT